MKRIPPHASTRDLVNWNYPCTAQAMADSPAYQLWAWVSVSDRGLCLDKNGKLWVAREATLTLQLYPSARAILVSEGAGTLAVWVPFTSYDYLFKSDRPVAEAYLPVSRVMTARPVWTY